MSYLLRFWNFLKEDNWQSWIVSLILLIVIIRFIFFPTLSFITGSSLPLVVIESCSLYHESSFREWWSRNAEWYEDRGITESEFSSFSYKNGLNKGDIIFVWGRTEYKKGDIIVFHSNRESTAKYPIIHRIIATNPISTKGDHNTQQLTRENNIQQIDETAIPKERVIGKALFRIPLVGWIKLIFFEPFRTSEQQGFCT